MTRVEAPSLAEIVSRYADMVENQRADIDLTPAQRDVVTRILRNVDLSGIADVDYGGTEDGARRREIIVDHIRKTFSVAVDRAVEIVRNA